MNPTKYYPAYLLNTAEYDNAKACLSARGCTEDEADKFITLAQIHQSEIVLHSAESPPDDFFLVIAEDGGKWRTWAARAQLIRDTREKAEALVESFTNDVQWRIFDIPQHESLQSMN
jgi:hypothetical protein